MANDALRQALADAKMTERQLAAAVGVDEKTASRWVADPNRVPHPRHRYAASEALGVDEEVLWPEAIRASIKTGADREVVAVYPYRSACPRSLWRDLITRSQRELFFGGYTNYFLWLEQSNLRNVLHRKAEAGARVRFLVGDPDSDVTRRREEIEDVPLTVSTRIQVTLDELRKVMPPVEGRFSDRHIATSVFVFDEDALVSVHLADLLGHDSPTLHLRKRSSDGLYDRFVSHLEHLWDNGRNIPQM
ncbi:helix-turn-helix transcriptional regulator [Actinomycetes bacterium KLBMP 9797]